MPLESIGDQSEHVAPLAGSDGEGSLTGTAHSPQYPSSTSEHSEQLDNYVHVDLSYPNEIPEDIHFSDSASESQPRIHRRHTASGSRAHSGQRASPRRQAREPSTYRLRGPAPESPESVDSADEFARAGGYSRADPRLRQSYHGPGHVVHMPPYAPSTSSGASYVYPQVPGPPSNQMVHYGAPPPMGYGQHYPQMGVPPSVGYPPAQPYPMSHHSGSHVGTVYGGPSGPSYNGQQVMPFGPAPGYYPSQYPAPYSPGPTWEPYHRFHTSPPPQTLAPPAPQRSSSPTHSSVSNAGVDQDEIVRRVEAMLLAEKKEREAREDAREAAAKAAAAEAAAQAERAAAEAAAQAERAAAEAAAKAERAASDAKIAEEAAAKAREEVRREAEAKAAEAAARAQAEIEAAARVREEIKREAEAKAAEAAARAQAEVEAAARVREELKKEAEAKAAEAAAKAQADVEAAARVREELKKEAEAQVAAAAAKAQADVEAAARVREELKKEAEAQAAAAAAQAQAEAEAAAKLLEKLRKEAEAKAIEEAAKAQAEADAKAERAASDAKIAEEAAANVRKEIAEAAAAAGPPPPDRKAPIRFKDAVGRKFNFPFHLCAKWSGMEELIRQAFIHVEGLGPHVHEGHYDLLGPNGEIILPQVWDTVVEPDWAITMHMWPMPEPEKPKTPPLPEGDIINLDDLLNPPKKPLKGKGAKKSNPSPPAPPPLLPDIDAFNLTFPLDAPAPPPPPAAPVRKEVDKASKKAGPTKTGTKKVVPSTGFSAWMMGGKPAKPPAKALKEIKKPDGSASSQHGATANGSSCIVM